MCSSGKLASRADIDTFCTARNNAEIAAKILSKASDERKKEDAVDSRPIVIS